MNIGLQNALITVFEFAVLRAFFEWVTRSGLRWSGRRWAWAGKLSMSEKTAERVFVALAVATVTILSVAGTGAASQRLLDGCYQALSTALILIVLLRIGIFASAIMFFVNFLLLRMPLTFDGNALYATGAWMAVAGIIALAARASGWRGPASRCSAPPRDYPLHCSPARVDTSTSGFWRGERCAARG